MRALIVRWFLKAVHGGYNMTSKKVFQFLVLLVVLTGAVPLTQAVEKKKTALPMSFILLLIGQDFKEVSSATGQTWMDRTQPV
jgi:hypothetical protein